MLAISYVDLAQDHFTKTRFFGLYHDDGNIVFNRNLLIEEIQSWLHDFQAKVNDITNSDDIQFTMEIWRMGETCRTIVPKLINVISIPTFPYLDMNPKFDEEKNLCFEIFSKPNFETKYLDLGSCHTRTCKNAVPRNIAIRLAGLTS